MKPRCFVDHWCIWLHLRPVGSRLASSARVHHSFSASAASWEDSDTAKIKLTCPGIQGGLVAISLALGTILCVCGQMAAAAAATANSSRAHSCRRQRGRECLAGQLSPQQHYCLYGTCSPAAHGFVACTLLVPAGSQVGAPGGDPAGHSVLHYLSLAWQQFMVPSSSCMALFVDSWCVFHSTCMLRVSAEEERWAARLLSA